MRVFLGRLVSIVVVAGGWLLFGAKAVLDLIGYSTVPDDTKIALGRLDDLFLWLLGVPWWVSFGFALATTALLMFVSWPRSQVPEHRQAPSTSLIHRAPAPLAVSPTSSPKSLEPILEERVFVPSELTLGRLVAIHSSNTSIIAEELTKQYIGKWMNFSGKVEEIYKVSDSHGVVVLEQLGLFDRNRPEDQVFVRLRFRRADQIERIRLLQKTDSIAVVGRISDIGAVTFELDDCELVEAPVSAELPAPKGPTKATGPKRRKPPVS